MLAEQYIQAKLCFQEASSVRTAALGDTHPDVAVSKSDLALDCRPSLSTILNSLLL